MKKIILILASSYITFISNQSVASTFTPNFSDYSFPGSQYTVDAAANAYYSANYGITVENAYLYVDSRDTFDGIGVANGTVAEIGTAQSGRINFLDTTNFVTLEVLTILDSTYSAYASDGTLIASVNKAGGLNDTFTLSGGTISYVLFSGTGGYTTVSGLTYDYDGTTDGTNTDISATPLPAAFPLMASALGLFGISIRRTRKS
jgi:hypothetical protein